MSVRLPQLLGVEDVELLLGVAEDLCTTTGAFSKRLQELRRQRHAERRRIRVRAEAGGRGSKETASSRELCLMVDCVHFRTTSRLT